MNFRTVFTLFGHTSLESTIFGFGTESIAAADACEAEAERLAYNTLPVQSFSMASPLNISVHFENRLPREVRMRLRPEEMRARKEARVMLPDHPADDVRLAGVKHIPAFD